MLYVGYMLWFTQEHEYLHYQSKTRGIARGWSPDATELSYSPPPGKYA